MEGVADTGTSGEEKKKSVSPKQLPMVVRAGGELVSYLGVN